MTPLSDKRRNFAIATMRPQLEFRTSPAAHTLIYYAPVDTFPESRRRALPNQAPSRWKPDIPRSNFCDTLDRYGKTAQSTLPLVSDLVLVDSIVKKRSSPPTL